MELHKLLNEVELNKLIEDNNFSGVVQVSQHGAPVFTAVKGYADRSNELPININTRFGIASGTKLFTALAIGKLIDNKELELTTRVFDVLKIRDRFPSYSPEVTIAQLLSHTSGLPDYFDEDFIEDFDNFKVAVPWNELERPYQYFEVFPHRPMKSSPGEKFSYSNSGYVLLAAVVEEVSGQKYTDFVKNEIFDKHNMQSSGFYPFNCLPKNTALGYVDNENGWITNIYKLPIIGGGDGGAYTTVNNLTNLWKALFNNEILSPELTQKFINEQAHDKDERYYGYGIWLYNYPNCKLEYIMGCDAGVSFQSGVVRSRSIEYTVISNTTEGAWPVAGYIRGRLS